MSNFTFYTEENTTGRAREQLQGIHQSYGFIPNLFAYMAEAPATIDAYLALNDLVSATSFTPAQQQIALLAVSLENGCDFCTAAHLAMGKMKEANPQTLVALRNGGEIDDPKDRVLAEFVRTVTRERGRQSPAALQAFLDAGFTRQQIFEVMLIVAIKTLSNYINHLTAPEANRELLQMR